MTENAPDFLAVQQQFSAHIRNPSQEAPIEGIEDRRLSIYRELFFNNIEGFAAGAFPVLKEILAEADWVQLVRDFFVTYRCETPYFLEISEEFLNYLQTAKQAFLPAFSYQLAHWEWMELHADIAECDDEAKPLFEIKLSDRITTVDCAWCLAYEYPVHKVSQESIPSEMAPSFLMVYRNEYLQVGFIEVNPLSYLLFERLEQNNQYSVESVLTQLAQDQNMDPSIVLKGGMEIIEQWAAIGVLKHITKA